MKDYGRSMLRYMIVGMIAILSVDTASAQVLEYNFDSQDLAESIGNYADGQTNGALTFECGVGDSSSALHFDGSIDTVSLDPGIKDLFLDDFTLSFYFWVDPAPQSVPVTTLVSIQSSCTRDSSLTIKYVNDPVNELRLEYATSLSEYVNFEQEVDSTSCWHHVLFSRKADSDNGATFSLYLNGEFIANDFHIDPVVLGEDFKIYLGYSDCSGTNDNNFYGRIDEFKIYDRAVDESILRQTSIFPDAIVARDTTIFQGDSHLLQTGTTCAPGVSWTPSFSLDDSTSPAPFASPEETTTYTVTFDNGGCVSTDQVTVYVLDEDKIDCNNLLLPKAFTPNGDDLNETYYISNNFIIEDLSRFEIYDRWGLKLFEAAQKNDEWDGFYNGTPLMPGTYVYKVEYTCQNESYQKTGSFNLIK